MKRILISLLSYGLLLTGFPLTMMAMEQEQPTPKQIYAGVIITMHNSARCRETVHAFPVARQTIVYELPQNHTPDDIFEYVDTVQAWNEPDQIQHIETETKAHIRVRSVSFAERNTQVSISGAYRPSIYPRTRGGDDLKVSIKLGHVSNLTLQKPDDYYGNNSQHPACFGPSTSSSQPEFLPYTSLFSNAAKEATIRDERLAKKPGNALATSIAFLRLEQRRRGSATTYIPSPCTDLTTILGQDPHID